VVDFGWVGASERIILLDMGFWAENGKSNGLNGDESDQGGMIAG